MSSFEKSIWNSLTTPEQEQETCRVCVPMLGQPANSFSGATSVALCHWIRMAFLVTFPTLFVRWSSNQFEQAGLRQPTLPLENTVRCSAARCLYGAKRTQY